MKFLFVAQRFHTNLYYRVIALQNAGHSVRVLVLYKGKSEFYQNVDIQQIKTSHFSNILLKIFSVFNKNKLKSALDLRIQYPGKELKKAFKEYKPNIVILKAFQNMLAIKTLIIAKKYNTKVLMLSQTNITHIKGSKFLFKLNIKLFRFLKVFAYITPIKSNYDAFKKFGIEYIYYLPFVFPSIKKQKKTFYNKDETINIISIGKFVKRKGHLLLIKAVKELLGQGFRIKLNIFGEIADNQYYNKVIEYIEKDKLQEHINIFTNISYKEILAEYKKNDLFILASYAEPAAYSIVEAMANGLPVICSSENGTKCYIANSKNGFIFEVKNSEDLKSKIKFCISDKINLSKNSLFFAEKYHNLEKFEKELINIILNS